MYDPKLDRLIIPEVDWDIEKNKFIDKDFKVGDKFLFIPCIYIDHYEASGYGGDESINLSQSTFHFIPIKKFCHPFNKHCYHYLIELASGMLMFHFNWNRKYKEYIRIGKKYWGMGRTNTCGNPSTENPLIPSNIIEDIARQGVIKNILVGRYWDYWSVELLPRDL